jgi:hypothetical protein
MNPHTRKVAILVVLGLLALPTGVCSLAFTPMAISGLWSRDSLAQGIGMLALIMSAIGFIICGVCVWGMVRVSRSTPTEPPKPMSSP